MAVKQERETVSHLFCLFKGTFHLHFRPTNLGSGPTVIHMSHWWCRQGIRPKLLSHSRKFSFCACICPSLCNKGVHNIERFPSFFPSTLIVRTGYTQDHPVWSVSFGYSQDNEINSRPKEIIIYSWQQKGNLCGWWVWFVREYESNYVRELQLGLGFRLALGLGSLRLPSCI